MIQCMQEKGSGMGGFHPLQRLLCVEKSGEKPTLCYC